MKTDRVVGSSRARVALGSGLVLGAVVAAGVVVDHRLGAQSSKRGAAGSGSVHALARLEPEAGLIVVGLRPGARVDSVEVKEGDAVKAGDLLAVAEGNAAAQAQLDLAEAQRKNARRLRGLQREKLAIEREQDDKTKDARLAAVKKAAEVARQRLDGTALLARTLKADQVREKAEAEESRFQGEVQKAEAEAKLKELEVAEELLARRRKLEDDQAADGQADDEALDRQVDAARAAVEQTLVKAPGPGRVLAVVARAGEVGSGPLLYLGDVSSMVAVAEVDQSEVPNVRVGDPAEVTVQGKAVAGKVTRVSGVVLPNRTRDVDPRALQDLRVVRVTVRLDDPSEASKVVNMQVEAAIRPRPSGSN